MAQDPVCGMEVDVSKGLKIEHAGKQYIFCSTYCRDKFIQQGGMHDAVVCAPAIKKPFFKNRLFIVSSAAVFLLLASYFIPLLVPFRRAFLDYLNKIWLAIIAGFIIGGIIDYFIPREYISKILSRKSPATILNAVSLGFLMSACSHGIIAISMQLHKKGASIPAVIAFLLASPWANFTITIMLFSFFGLKALFIIFGAIIIALNSGFIFMFLEKKGLIETNKNIVEVSEQFSILKDLKIRAKNYKFSRETLICDAKGVISGSAALAEMVLWWIILGMLIASLAGAYIPVHFFHKFMGPTIMGLAVTLILATVIEVCSEGSSPLAFEIYKQTNALGNSFVFLMAGVATDYTEIGIVWANIGRKTAIWLPVVTVPQIIILGIAANFIFR